MENQPPVSYSKRDAALEAYALVGARRAVWGQLLPRHRLPVIAKTPMLVAVGVYVSGGYFAIRSVGLTMVLAACLWTVLYAINESTDLECEQGYRIDTTMRLLLGALCIGLCLASVYLSFRLTLLLAAMALGQAAYCIPPLRLKRHWWAVLLLSGGLNPILRLECGALWGKHAIPLLAYFTFVSLHQGASIRSRCLLRARDSKLGYRVAPTCTEWAGMLCTGVGFLGAYILCAQHVLPPIFVLFTTIAALFAVYAWSGRVTSMARLRQGWIWFALLSLAALAALLSQRP